MTGSNNIAVRRSAERGQADHGWLKSQHSFSFANYHDPAHMGFRSLRVINDDRVIGGAGFPTHGHRDMEIVSYVVSGAIEHKDSNGHQSVLRAGEVQRMSAGTGVYHSEFNPSPSQELRFLQLWILPDQRGREPGYQQAPLDDDARRGHFWRFADASGERLLTIHQDVALSSALLASGDDSDYRLDADRYAWLQVVTGRVAFGDVVLEEGDGLSMGPGGQLSLRALADSDLLLFDLA